MSNLFQRLAGRAQGSNESLEPRRPYRFEDGGRLDTGAPANDRPRHQGLREPAPEIESPGGLEERPPRGDAQATPQAARRRTSPRAEKRRGQDSSAPVAGHPDTSGPAPRIPLEPRPVGESTPTAQAAGPPEAARTQPLQPKRQEPRDKAPRTDSAVRPAAEPPSPREAASRHRRADHRRSEPRRSQREPGEEIPQSVLPAAARDRQSSEAKDHSQGSGAEDSGSRSARSLAPKAASFPEESFNAQSAPAETVVRVTIGSLEVRAVTPQPSGTASGPPPRPLAKPRTSLADYQKRRGGRG